MQFTPKVFVTLGFFYRPMIIFLQYTLTDLRAFTDQNPFVLVKPNWPSPTPYQQFVRGTGQVIQRRKRGLHGWVGENYICKIGKSVRFEKAIPLYEDKYIKPIFQHLYAGENQVLTKYEFVFRLNYEKWAKKLTYNDIRDIIGSLLNSMVHIRINGKYITCKVRELQKILPQLHFETSTNKHGRKAGMSAYIDKCTPQLYIATEDDTVVVGLGKNFNNMSENQEDFDLYGAWHDHINNPYRVWVQDDYAEVEGGFNRSLRMTIMRLHSEYECLKNIFRSINEKKIEVSQQTTQANELQRYLNRAIKTFLRSESSIVGLGGDANFLDYFSKVFSKAQPGELDELVEKIKEYEFRPNVENKTLNFIQQNHIEFMNNKFENDRSVILSQGDNNTVSGNTINQQNYELPADTDYEVLVAELADLKARAVPEAKSADDFKAVVAIAEAEEAAKKKDSKGLINALKAGGKFLVDVANKFSASVLVELLKQHSTFI
ncbi:hypothetical protein [Pedobacter sp. GR22-10]|uniref:hypothetical protein n=1 Tax=Pedobacter sp. GR22-10 TaxID=2994472 RepID=UPI002245C9D5|nr:hypothetical protein [Pedobacter sp. GR22-10]MCX2430544.1 hypothetical protein [Pedobacter sp. GR22-10]